MFLQKEKILITGCSGLVGSYLLRELAVCGAELYATQGESKIDYDPARIINIDLTNTEIFFEELQRLKPSVIVNLAAYTDVDGCETDRIRARILNADLVSAISNYAKKNNRSFVLHVSTEYVFDGKIGNYLENSEPSPINWYGASKLLGEKEIITKIPTEQWCIARISTPFGIHNKKQSFPIFVISNLAAKKQIKVLDDQYTTPIYAKTLSIMLMELLEKTFTGLIHIASKNGISRFEQALKVARMFGLDTSLINRVNMEEMNWKAARPRISTLNVTAANRILDNKPPEFDADLLGLHAEIKKRI
jgi:dTDP-4-dehydrorhamnose reductase